MENFLENPYAYFNYLQTCKGGDYIHLLSEVTIGEKESVKENKYYNALSFKIFICEIIYNAINLFPEIEEYTISCSNENGTSHLKLGIFGELSDDGFQCLGKFISIEAEDIYSLN